MKNRKQVNGVYYELLYPPSTDRRFNNGVRVKLWIDSPTHRRIDIDIELLEGCYDERAYPDNVPDQIREELSSIVQIEDMINNAPRYHAVINEIVQRHLMPFLL
jgi:hypothetical protein